ncbi:MAG: winged helix-turn-helix domain-containing protein [Candidatus Eremiobacteraeota bacterium]|nr:winged helix-turn-helix domain-containing protein [Candidatus Eremiobacteraeota bacterium]
MDVYEFGPFHLDVERLLLVHEGEPVALGPKVVETLLALVEHPGEVLAKAMLLDRIWPEGFVEEANLAQNIYVLRKTLRARWAADAIETVPRRGYRFTAPVHRLERAALAEAPVVAHAVPAAPVTAATDIHRQPARRLPSMRWIAAAASAVAILAASFVLLASVVTHRANAGDMISDNGARLYQIGRYYWNLRSRDGVEKSLSYFAQVIDSDPKSARGYAALAEANATMGNYRYGSQTPAVYFARARGYAEKALLLDPNSAEAHAALGLIALNDKNMPKAMSELQHAIALDPGYGPAREWYGIGLVGEGQLRTGFAELKRAADLDPLSVATTAWLGSTAYYDRHFHDAITYSQQALELSPQRTDALMTIGEAYEAEGNITRAIEVFKQYASSSAYAHAEGSALLAHAYAIAHRYAEARAELAYARAHSRDVEQADLAIAAAALGDRSVAFALLRRMRTHATWMAISHDPRFDSLRDDAEFRQLAQESA